MVRGLATRAACARFACRGVFAALLALCGAACSETTSSNTALTSGASGPTVAFESIDGPPVGVFNRLVDNLSSEAQARQVSIASRQGAANYRVRGYLAAQVIRGRTSISWVFDVYDDVKIRTLRITGEEAGGRGGADPWSVADGAMLRKIASASMDRLAAFLRNPDGPADPSAAVADAGETRPASAAERLAYSAAR